MNINEFTDITNTRILNGVPENNNQSKTTEISSACDIFTNSFQNSTNTRILNEVKKNSNKPKATERSSASDTFKSIFTNEMVDLIVRHTNEKAQTVCAEFNKASSKAKRKQIFWRDLTNSEFYSFVGILIAAGANNANTDSSMDMWKVTSYPLYRATMSINRFWNILRFIRFDDSKDRNLRTKTDKLSPIRDVWTMLNANLSKVYQPGKNLTAKDQFFPFKGLTGFTQYNPSKPAKYGIKIWWVCDADNSYPLHGEIDTGERRNTRQSNHDEKEANQDSRGRVSKESFYAALSSVKSSISQNLRDIRIKRKNRMSVLKEMNAKDVVSGIFGQSTDVNLVAKAIDSCAASADNNCMDKLLRRFTTHRRTVKWPLALFFNLIDVATFASYLIYHESNDSAKSSTSQQRRSFMRQLSEELCLPSVEERAKNHQAVRNFSTRLAIESVLARPIQEFSKVVDEEASPRAPGPKPIVGCCFFCQNAEGKRRRKTRQACGSCAKPVCSGHSKTFVKCYQCK